MGKTGRELWVLGGHIMYDLHMKRVYENVKKEDGFRILVDRLWPRGVKKEELSHDEWAKNIAPTAGLRKAFNHEKDKFAQFKTDYLNELAENEAADAFIETVREQLKEQNVTLLYAAKDTETNHVVVLSAWLKEQLKLN